MKVLHVSGATSWGGNEQQMVDLIPELSKLGVVNFVFGVENSPLQKECEKSGIKFVVAKRDKLNKIVNYRYLKTLVKELKPDLIHLHTSDSLTVFTISDLLFRLKIKAVFSKKGMGSSSSILSKFKYNYKNVAAFICVSEAVKKSFSKIITKGNLAKLKVVYDGINLNRANFEKTENIKKEFDICEDNIVIGNIANHVKAKDLVTLIKSIHHLVYNLGLKKIHLLQIGKFSDKLTPEIQCLIEELKLEKYITLTNFNPNALGFLSQFDLFVMSSEREGLPLTIFEAFLKKTPVVSTKAGGIPEAISNGFNGYLCDIRDFENLALSIQKLLNDKEKQEEFVTRSYDIFFEKFTAEKSASNTLKLYKNIIK